MVTLPQLFKTNGYFVQGMGKIYHLGLDDTNSWSIPATYPQVKASQRGPADPDAAPVSAKRGPPFESVDVPDNALHDGELKA